MCFRNRPISSTENSYIDAGDVKGLMGKIGTSNNTRNRDEEEKPPIKSWKDLCIGQYLELIKLVLLAIIAVCGIILVIQGFGGGTQDVYVRGGDIDANVRGSVDVDNTVDVSGSVEVDNTVDVNLIEVLGDNVGCHESYKASGDKYWAIDVYAR